MASEIRAGAFPMYPASAIAAVMIYVKSVWLTKGNTVNPDLLPFSSIQTQRSKPYTQVSPHSSL